MRSDITPARATTHFSIIGRGPTPLIDETINLELVAPEDAPAMLHGYSFYQSTLPLKPWGEPILNFEILTSGVTYTDEPRYITDFDRNLGQLSPISTVPTV